MRIKLFVFIALVTSIPDFVQNDIQAQEYNQGMARYDDPISGRTLMVQQFVSTSQESPRWVQIYHENGVH